MRATTARQLDHRGRGSNGGGGIRLAVVAAGLAVLALPAMAARAQQAACAGNVAVKVGDPSIRPGGSTTVTAEPPQTAAAITYHWIGGAGLRVAAENAQMATVTVGAAGSYKVDVEVAYTDVDASGAPTQVTACGSATIEATNVAPVVKIKEAPATAQLGRSYQLRADASDGDGDAPNYTWSDSLGADFAGAGDRTTWTPRVRGTHTVTVAVDDRFGGFDSAPVNITVPDRQPRAAFTVSGTGLTRTLRSTSSDPDDDPLAHAWSVSGGGRVSPTDTRTARVRFPGPGVYVVRLTVSERNGTLSDRESDAIVIEGPVTGTGRPPEPPPVARQRLIEPFPIVRIRGRVFRGATKFDVFSVMAPKGSHIRIRCAGRSCRHRWSAASMRRTRWRRFHRLERRMRAGTVLHIFVVQPGRIGKYTRFAVRGSKPPARRDRCVSAVKRLRVIRCPAG